MREEEIVSLASVALGGVCALAIFGLFAFVAFTLMKSIQALPEQHQQLPPWAPWLMLVPCVNIFANFWIFIFIAKSYESEAQSRGATLAQPLLPLGIGYAACGLANLIPYLNFCTVWVSFGLLAGFVFMLKKAEAEVLANAGSSGGPMAAPTPF